MKSSQERGNSTIEAGDVVDQIFDMIKPRDPTQITLKDLKDSGVSIQDDDDVMTNCRYRDKSSLFSRMSMVSGGSTKWSHYPLKEIMTELIKN